MAVCPFGKALALLHVKACIAWSSQHSLISCFLGPVGSFTTCWPLYRYEMECEDQSTVCSMEPMLMVRVQATKSPNNLGGIYPSSTLMEVLPCMARFMLCQYYRLQFYTTQLMM
ncbi:hypothetical protein Mapa_004452 [Marchantia paleacea]|nr:hypothetical protein Mapa_004452 [Marchantia paleacea]